LAKNVTPNHPFSINLTSLKNSLFTTLNIAPWCSDIKIMLEMARPLEHTCPKQILSKGILYFERKYTKGKNVIA